MTWKVYIESLVNGSSRECMKEVETIEEAMKVAINDCDAAYEICPEIFIPTIDYKNLKFISWKYDYGDMSVIFDMKQGYIHPDGGELQVPLVISPECIIYASISDIKMF